MESITPEELQAFLNAPALEMDVSTEKSKGKEEKGNYFAVVLYPDEDVDHAKFMRYITSRPQYDYVYIRHIGESTNADGSQKKDHVHMLIKTLDRMAIGSFVKYFEGWINYAECIHSPKAYVMYLLHDTPAAIEAGKKPYSVKDLVGSSRLYKHLIQNSHFVQLNKIISHHPFQGSFLDTYNALPDEDKKELGEFMWSYYHIVKSEIDSDNNNIMYGFNSSIERKK